jgi:prepilin-type N-terminal cleavage/methylation domain-containing protein
MKQKGFTLIELMVTVAILGILAAVAIPVYNNYVYKSKTAEATTNISGIRTLQESWFAENNRYCDTVGDCNPSTAAVDICCAQAPTGAPVIQKTGWTAANIAAWNSLGFAPTGNATYYAYAVLTTANTTRLTIGALGDLDGDGATHIFVMPTGQTVVGTDNIIMGVTVTFTATSSGTIIEGGAGVW